MDVSENSGTPKSSIFNRVFHYKPSIFGVLETPISTHCKKQSANSSNSPLFFKSNADRVEESIQRVMNPITTMKYGGLVVEPTHLNKYVRQIG